MMWHQNNIIFSLEKKMYKQSHEEKKTLKKLFNFSLKKPVLHTKICQTAIIKIHT